MIYKNKVEEVMSKYERIIGDFRKASEIANCASVAHTLKFYDANISSLRFCAKCDTNYQIDTLFIKMAAYFAWIETNRPPQWVEWHKFGLHFIHTKVNYLICALMEILPTMTFGLSLNIIVLLFCTYKMASTKLGDIY